MIIEHLSVLFPRPETALCYVYCDGQASVQQSASNLVGSLLRQLIESHNSMPKTVLEAYREKKEGKVTLSLDECLKMFLQLSGGFRRVFIVLDALDECAYLTNCEDTSRMHLMEGTLNELLSASQDGSNNIGVYVTSRFRPQTQVEELSFETIEISSQSADLYKFIKSEFTRPRSELSWANPQLALRIRNDSVLLDEIVATCVEQADNMCVIFLLFESASPN